ncbi:related to YPC1 - Alkaline Ceramidase [Cephalotrichum gorgonifer]|uniref:Related to YPC1 - Alkaline Ceramidase n=1 Tax=Cephalotrichum gorgonifer TaxID=2041049 RepID=A0AAE8N331_9PEZI|nr:related to YPC1 - Alkaline Ceramidase [Cephalotrichum gorgonifer]
MGHHNRHFAGDKYALHGAWSPPTSAANFCEEDYVVTRYIAEFINALTNLSYIFFALRYMYGPGSQGLLSPRRDSMAASLLLVGIGSFFYHASLRQTLQFGDDLSMIVLSGTMLNGVFTVRQTPARARTISALITLASLAFSAFYVYSGKIIYHFTAFTSQIILLTLRCVYIYRRAEPRFSEAKVRAWRRVHGRATLILLLAFALWNVDLEFCAELRELREKVGLPWAWLLELHGWWHVLTAWGAAMFMNVVRDMQDEERREKAKAVQGKDK